MPICPSVQLNLLLLKMEVYNFTSESESETESVFGGFDTNDVNSAIRTYETVSRSRESISSISSVSSSSSDEIEPENNEFESDSDTENNQVEPDDGNSVIQSIDLHVNPPDWTTDLVPIHVPGFQLQSGPQLPDGWDIRSTPLQYFELFFTAQLIEEFVQYTKSYAQLAIRKKPETMPIYTDRQWSLDGSNNVSVEEMCAYLGCCLILSVNPTHQLKHAFSSDPFMCNHGVRSIFTLRRFTKIGQYLCIYDKWNELLCNSPHYDRWYKFKNLVEHLNTVFPRYYKFSEYQAIDESLIKTKCRLLNIIYAPDKPARRGLKIWCRCDAKNSKFLTLHGEKTHICIEKWTVS